MQILENVSLRDYSTMRLGGTARYVADITTRMELSEAVAWAEERQLPVIMVGGGSNLFWKDEGFAGLLLVNKIQNFQVFDEDGRNVYITAGGGESWDSVVARAANEGLTGIEALSLIPGTAGAAPVQNIGAYGQELGDTLTTVEVFDRQTKQFVTLRASDCALGYRTSRFKTTDRGRFFITGITMHLTRGLPQPPFYRALDEYLTANNLTNPTPQTIRDAVISVRTSKLPDPAVVANCGSFFSNPIIDDSISIDLIDAYPTVPYWRVDDTHIKIPAAWLIENAGFKDYTDTETGMATWSKQPLVFVNEHAKTTADLLAFRQKITNTVRDKFKIELQQEPELLPDLI